MAEQRKDTNVERNQPGRTPEREGAPTGGREGRTGETGGTERRDVGRRQEEQE